MLSTELKTQVINLPTHDRLELIQAIDRNLEHDRKMNQIFYFCIELAICFVVWKVRH